MAKSLKSKSYVVPPAVKAFNMPKAVVEFCLQMFATSLILNDLNIDLSMTSPVEQLDMVKLLLCKLAHEERWEMFGFTQSGRLTATK